MAFKKIDFNSNTKRHTIKSGETQNGRNAVRNSSYIVNINPTCLTFFSNVRFYFYGNFLTLIFKYSMNV